MLGDPINLTDPAGLWSYASEYGTNGDCLSSNMTRTEDLIDEVYNSLTGHDAVVTYTTNGTHGQSNNGYSYHYNGNAVDLRTRDMTYGQRVQATSDLQYELDKAYGEGAYDVIFEGDHIHTEYNDPSGPSLSGGSSGNCECGD